MIKVALFLVILACATAFDLFKSAPSLFCLHLANSVLLLLIGRNFFKEKTVLFLFGFLFLLQSPPLPEKSTGLFSTQDPFVLFVSLILLLIVSFRKKLFISLGLILPLGYFAFKSATVVPSDPLLKLDPYRHLLSFLKSTPSAVTIMFKGGVSRLPEGGEGFLTLPETFFEPTILITGLILLSLLVGGLFLHQKRALYLGLFWFSATLSPLVAQSTFGKIGYLPTVYLPSIGLFLIFCCFIEKFVSR